MNTMTRKLEDVMYYYIGQKYVMITDPTTGLMTEPKVFYGYMYDEVVGEENDKYTQKPMSRIVPGKKYTKLLLLLRTLDSMTSLEFEAIVRKLSPEIWSAVNDHFAISGHQRKWVAVLENRLRTNTLTFNDGLVLMKEGYDLFGLIESGDAVDMFSIPN